MAETVRLGKMNLAMHGLAGDIREGNAYYEDLHASTGQFDFVMANPLFNVDRVDKDRLKDDPRFPFGLPRTDNANYLWIQLFYSALNDTGRAGFVMANSACDARDSELEIRRQIVEDGDVDVMVAVGSNFFYTVTLPCTLWFFDKGKSGTAAPQCGSSGGTSTEEPLWGAALPGRADRRECGQVAGGGVMARYVPRCPLGAPHPSAAVPAELARKSRSGERRSREEVSCHTRSDAKPTWSGVLSRGKTHSPQMRQSTRDSTLAVRGCFPDSVIGFIADPAESDARFIMYYIDLLKLDMVQVSHGTTQDNLSQDKLLRFDFVVPDVHEQRKIAAILSAYDDLIENNLRRIKILEEMAQNLYREWFVKFRFPGHHEASFTDSPLGRIPGWWDVVKMPEAVQVRPSLPVPKSEQMMFVPMASLSITSMLIGDVEYRPEASGARFQNGDILFARITPCLENGKTNLVQFLPTDDTVACGSTEFIVLRSKTVCAEYVYLMARSDAFRDNAIKSMSGATGRQRVNEKCFDQFLLSHPPVAILEHFQVIVRPHFGLIHLLGQRNETLRRIRDLLLPRLISGEVDVSELDIAVPEEAV